MPKIKGFEDAVAILTDAELRQALERRRDLIKQRLADLTVDRMMPDWQETAMTKQTEAILIQALNSIQERLDGASKLLRAFNGPKPELAE